MRLGILGGTFDPIHNGHLDAAVAASRALELDRTLVVPAGVPPHRSSQPHASAWHRFAMAALAVDERDGLSVSDLEMSQAAPSFTWHTLQRLHGLGYNPSQIFFIAGADAIAKLATWFNYPALLDACHFVGVARPGFSMSLPDDLMAAAGTRLVRLSADTTESNLTNAQQLAASGRCSIVLLEAATADVSGTDVRARVASGRSLAGLVPDAVARHIYRHELYRQPHPAAGALHASN
jgi:nicotinate-nucleotide adenylyltransferase